MGRLPSAGTRSLSRAVWLALVLGAGCSPPGPPEFRLNTEGRDPQTISPAQAEEITGKLRRLFGTPDEPHLPAEVDLRLDRLQQAAGPIGSDEQGNQFGLYRQHCASCHGISGDGAGPIAAALNPYPRDFRNGLYKYTSTAGGAKPVREDLLLALERGNPGTAMPSFRNLRDAQLEALLEYVQYLSLRGETELFLLAMVVDADWYPLDMTEVINDGLLPLVGLWREARFMVVEPQQAKAKAPPVATPQQLSASIVRGYQLYSSENAKCVQCHGPEGRGDGAQSQLYDDWNKDKIGHSPEETRKLAALYRLPAQSLRPRDFTKGVFHGGRRPIDLYWRIYVGIKGTPMPGAGPAPGTAGVLPPEEIWHVVDYVRSRARVGGRGGAGGP